ncbi:MAG: aminoacyl-tRNA hydrolase [Candidatus Gracilibacteria bacterium]
MHLIVGLGNPGYTYRETRHNIGFLFLDALKDALGIKNDWQSGYKGVYATGVLEGQKVILLKPLTYMNLSGQSVLACAQFYKIPLKNIIIISDDIDMAFGKIRYRATGNAGGHNGIASLIESLGTKDIQRIKIGIDRHPKMDPTDWVLSKFTKDEKEKLGEVFNNALEKLGDVISSPE